jgi:hypothetical protein
MDDATFKWSSDVEASASEAESLRGDITRIEHALNDLVHTINDLRTVRFGDDVEEYEILEKARQLWDSVSGGVSGIRSSASSLAADINDLRRVVDFHSR